MSSDHQRSTISHLVWLDTHSATKSLCVTGRLETTRELRKLGWQVTLVLEGNPSQQSIREVEVVCIAKPQLYFIGIGLFHLRFLRLLIRKWSTIDVILFHPISALWLLPLRLVRRPWGTKRPMLVMDTRDLDPPGVTPKKRLRLLYRSVAGRLANHMADGQTAITQRMADIVRIPPKQLWGTWPSGVNLEKFFHVHTAQRWSMTGESVHLIYIGSLHPVRNLLPLCHAIEKANDEGMKFELLFIGDGEAQVDLGRFASQTAGRISVLPPVPHDRIPEFLALAHVGVTSLFSTDIEQFQATSPIKLFEYMAAGLPILATRSASYTDVVGDGKYVFWAESADILGILTALRHIWEARSTLKIMGREAVFSAKGWTWHESARKLKSALEYGLAKYP